jgi:predicted lipid-binding transport protein (Tim44 family)
LIAISIAVAGLTLSLGAHDAEAKRLGGGKPAGMQRSTPATTPGAAPTGTNPGAQSATPAAPAAPAPAAPAPVPGKRSWLGPIAGLAAGLGLAALFSHLGMGEGFANVVMMLMLAVVAFVAVRWLMARFASAPRRDPGLQLAGAGAGAPAPGWPTPATEPMQRNALDSAPTAANMATASTATLPGGMAAADFERLAKMVFVRLQAANDACNIEDLRKFTTPELFASLRVDLQERGGVAQQTDVVQLDAKVLEAVEEGGQAIVTVRFQGLIREDAGSGAAPFNELWHLVRPLSGGDWAIAGITPVQ